MWQLAIKTLVADRGKLLTALVGITFSVVLVNLQGGLFMGLIRKASLLVDHGQADVWVGHRNMHSVDFPRDIPRRWLDRVQSVPGVLRADPYTIGYTQITLPSGGYEPIVLVGAELGSPMGKAWNLVSGDAGSLRQTDAVIVDASEDDKLESPQPGDIREIGGRRARIVAKSYGVAGFLTSPYIFTTYERAARYLEKPTDSASYFLVQLQPGADALAVCAAIRHRLPDVEAYPRDVYSWISINFWITRTGLGISFGAATLLGLLVGLVIVAQTLYALVLDRITEFGTLKALGASEGHLLSILVVQALSMAVAGSIVGLVLVSVVQRVYNSPKVPIAVPVWLALGSCLLVMLICLLSALLPYLRVRKVDPLIVLQS